MPVYKVDFHVHTVLSPCAEVEMIPPLIVSRALEVGLDMIGITDHNSAENVAAVMEASERSPLKVVPGIECESAEGVHLICLFDTVEDALTMQEFIYSALPSQLNKPDTFGAQFVVDATGEFVRYNDRLLLVPTTLTIEQVSARVEAMNGLVMPGHVDRSAYGIYSMLGFLPTKPCFRAVEISRHISQDEAKATYPDLISKFVFQCSDAHRLEDLGSAFTYLELEHRTVADVKHAVRKAVEACGQ